MLGLLFETFLYLILFIFSIAFGCLPIVVMIVVYGYIYIKTPPYKRYEEGKTACVGCKNLAYDCCGQAECLKNRDEYCPHSEFAYREE